eukprot:m.89857 g.89857  ORF g.89857 m.89857 type:complete len:57 (-) comp8839_c5_seq6:263-433(-)
MTWFNAGVACAVGIGSVFGTEFNDEFGDETGYEDVACDEEVVCVDVVGGGGGGGFH